MGKSKAQLAQEARWNPAVEKLISRAMSGTIESALSIMGVAVRSAENTIDRLTYLSKAVRRQIEQVMEGNQIDEFRASRLTFLKLVDVYAIKKDVPGEMAYEALVATYGKKFTRQLVKRQVKRIPAKEEVNFEIDEHFLDSLEPEKRRAIAKIIGNKRKLYVGDVPKRAKQARPARKREGYITRRR